MDKSIINMLDVASRVEKIRKHLRLNQDEFGKILGLSQGLVTRLEGGARKLDMTSIAILNKQHFISLDYIFYGEGDIIEKEKKEQKQVGEDNDKNIQKLINYIDYLENEINSYKKHIQTFANALDAKGIDAKELLGGERTEITAS